jgi:hypothetical protein
MTLPGLNMGRPSSESVVQKAAKAITRMNALERFSTFVGGLEIKHVVEMARIFTGSGEPLASISDVAFNRSVCKQFPTIKANIEECKVLYAAFATPKKDFGKETELDFTVFAIDVIRDTEVRRDTLVIVAATAISKQSTRVVMWRNICACCVGPVLLCMSRVPRIHLLSPHRSS